MLQLVGILFPNINDDAWSKPHQIYIANVLNMPWLTIQQTPICINLFPSSQCKGTEACFHHLSVINDRPEKGK